MKHFGFDTMSKWAYPWYIIFHPFDGFQELRYNNKGSRSVVSIILVFFFLGEAYRKLGTAFDFNNYNVKDVNIIMLLFTTVGLFFVVTAANWGFCTLLDGKGNYKNICVVIAYALIPYICICFFTTTVTRFLVLSEGGFLEYMIIVSQLWSVLIAFAGLQSIHEYSAKKTIGSLLLTFLGVLIILFIAFLVVMLFQQVLLFIQTIWLEATRR